MIISNIATTIIIFINMSILFFKILRRVDEHSQTLQHYLLYVIHHTQMKTVIKSLIILSLVCSTLLAEEGNSSFELERLQIAFSTQEGGNTSPNLFVPFYWNAYLFSGVGYESVALTSSEFSDSANVLEVTQQEYYSLNILQYQQKIDSLQYSIGLALKYSDVENSSMYSIPSYSVSLNALTDIKAFNVGISGDVAYKDIGDFFSIRAGGSLYPYATLDVTHNLNEYSVNSNDPQEVTYNFFVNTIFKSGFGLDLGLFASYRLDAYNYTINDIDNSLQPTGYTSEVKTSFKTLRAEVKLLLSAYSTNEIYPMVGYAYENVHSDYGAGQDKTTNNLLVFGFERPF